MSRLFKSFLFKLTKDLTFRITLIIGVGLALLETFLFFMIDYGIGAIDSEINVKLLTGPTMFMNSLSPVQNFGIAIPVNLISFVCLEFSQGSIRNKIISGHSKFKIYISLFLSGLVFAFALLTVYVGLCTGLGSIFGGFDLSKPVFGLTGGGLLDAKFIWQTVAITIFVYIAIVSFTIFFATLFRSIGPCIPIVIIVLMFLYLGGTIFVAIGDLFESDIPLQIMKFVNPLFALGSGAETEYVMIDDELMGKSYYAIDTFIGALVNNTVYAILFLVGGAFIFAKRDVK